jgi:hypothetical protein
MTDSSSTKYQKAQLEEIEEEQDKGFSVDLKDRDLRSEDPQISRASRRIFLSLLISLGVTQTLYMNISVFLPTFVDKNHKTITSGGIGVVLR